MVQLSHMSKLLVADPAKEAEPWTAGQPVRRSTRRPASSVEPTMPECGYEQVEIDYLSPASKFGRLSMCLTTLRMSHELMRKLSIHYCQAKSRAAIRRTWNQKMFAITYLFEPIGKQAQA